MKTEDLSGARWSSAVRCRARAIYQGLHTPPDEAALGPIRKFFDRGANAAEAWVITQEAKYAAVGRPVERERAIVWGLDWEGHADLSITEEKVIVEAYHSTTAEVLHAKALQAAGYATMSGREWRAMLAVIDATDVDIDLGFGVYTFPVDVDELRAEVEEIMAAVVRGVQRGTVLPEDRVSDSPNHEECRTCPFREHCWADWVAPEIEELEGHELLGQEMLNETLEISRLRRELKDAETRRGALRETMAIYIPPGQERRVGPVIVKRSRSTRRSFSIAGYLDAGHPLVGVMEDFYTINSSDRWTVTGL